MEKTMNDQVAVNGGTNKEKTDAEVLALLKEARSTSTEFHLSCNRTETAAGHLMQGERLNASMGEGKLHLECVNCGKGLKHSRIDCQFKGKVCRFQGVPIGINDSDHVLWILASEMFSVVEDDEIAVMACRQAFITMQKSRNDFLTLTVPVTCLPPVQSKVAVTA